MTPHPQILFVDDEPAILEGLQGALRPERHRWTMRFALGAEEALLQLAQRGADVVVSDMRMPVMDGHQLLDRARHAHPRTARMILSGYADLASVVRATGVAHQFLGKPCDTGSLRAAVERMLELRGLLPDRHLQELVGGIGALPTAPAAFEALVLALRDPAVTVQALAALVAADAGLSARVLQLAHAPYFGAAHRAVDLEEAIGAFGIATLRQVVLTVELIQRDAVPLPVLEAVAALQRHALVAAEVARELAGPGPGAAAASVAGLLHDAGKLVLLTRLTGPFGAATAQARRLGRPAHELERRTFGASHAQVGAYLLGLWGLPAAVVDAVARHHDEAVAAGPAGDLPGVVAAADLLAHGATGPLDAPASARLRTLAGSQLGSWLELASRCAARVAA